MDMNTFQTWTSANPVLTLGLAVGLFLLTFLLTRLVFGRGLTTIANLTKSKYDDIIIKKLHPNRTSLLVPFILLYLFAYLAPDYQVILEKVSLFFILWITLVTFFGLFDAVNQIYESSPNFNGVSLQGFLEIFKILLVAVGFILSISLLTGESPLLLLGGLGALTAVLLLVFQDTIMSLIASVQISMQNLVHKGDWLEVPSFSADGDVINMSLYNITVQNWVKTITVIPTSKLIQESYKNWRGMTESGGRRIKRSIPFDQNSLRFCTSRMIARFAKIDLISDYVAEKQKAIAAHRQERGDINSLLDGPKVTNIEFFRAYVEAYLRGHSKILSKKMTFLIRELAPSSTGLPLEIYVFTNTTVWAEYESIQADIFDHLLAAAALFDLKVYQE